MKKNILATLLLALTMSMGFSSCEDMLTGDMDRHIEIDELAQDTLYSYWGILRSLQHIAERYVILGEGRGDLIDGTQYLSDSISSILNFGLTGDASDGSNRYLKAADFYHVVNSCNAYIYRADTAKVSGLNRPLMLSEYAQVASIRAWAYLQLVLNYGRVPYFEEPMLSTADMEEFRKSAQYVDANSLASSGVAKLVDKLRYVPPVMAGDSIRVIGYPNYYNYGRSENNSIIAHSTQCIFPQDLVLGDIFLLRAQGEGSEADYRQAAQHYYNFLNSDKGGPLLPNSLYAFMKKNQRIDQYDFYYGTWLSMFSNNTAQTGLQAELVTIIPSNKNKLWGEVLRGINELFGYDATISVNTSASDSVTSASINLQLNYEHQLDASKAYFNLSKSQNFEAYIGTSDLKCTVLPGAGDARYWLATNNYVDTNKGAQEEVNFVQKQNPYGVFSTTYPVIYRKASIWLRFAEALNGAGFPGYAFAILRHGLIGTEGWIPEQYRASRNLVYKLDDELTLTVESESDYEPEGIKYFDPTTLVAGEDTTFYMTYPDFFDSCLREGLDTLATHQDSVTFFNAHIKGKAYSYHEKPLSGTSACDYISLRETKQAKSASFLDFSTTYLRGSTSQTQLSIYGGIDEKNLNPGAAYSRSSSNGPVTMGIHARGSGVLRIDEPNTTYNYVDQINKMLGLYFGQATPLTTEEIYDPANLRTVQKAIAALILDEQALETSFEGNRFFDLLCYSRLVGGSEGVEHVARKIASRSGELNQSLYSHLLNQNNWYFKLPQ